MKTINYWHVAGWITGLAGLFVVAAAQSDTATAYAADPVSAMPGVGGMRSVVPATANCFGCYPGAMGSPVICPDESQHFDLGSSPSPLFAGDPHPDMECQTSTCSVHDSCGQGPGGGDSLIISQLRRELDSSIVHGDAAPLAKLLHENGRLRFWQAEPEARGTMQVLNCSGGVALEFALSAAQARALAQELHRGGRPVRSRAATAVRAATRPGGAGG